MTRKMTLSNGTQTISAPEPAALPALPPGCVWNDDGSVTLTLSKALSIASTSSAGRSTETVPDLTFRDLTAGDLIDSSEYRTGGARTLFLLCASSGRVGPAGETLLRGMSARDYVKATRVLDLFTSDGPRTGMSV